MFQQLIKKHLVLLPIFLMALLASLSQYYLVVNARGVRLYDLAENILFAALLYIPAFFIKKRYLLKGYLRLAYLLFTVGIVVETFFFITFRSNISASAFFVMLQTNTSEASEFLSFYLKGKLLWVILLQLLLYVVFFIGVRRVQPFAKTFRLEPAFIISAYVFAGVIVVRYQLKHENVFYLAGLASLEYSKQFDQGDYEKLGRQAGVFSDSVYKGNEEATLVVAIGESTNRRHFGLYGYERETTPLLKAMKDELVVFDSVISPHAYTLGALTKMLTLGNYEKPEEKFRGSIIQLANDAGFETFWLSNQRPVGVYENAVTKMAKAADNVLFKTTSVSGQALEHDDELFPFVEDALQHPAKKKLIFVHLLGTHMDYGRRYPESYRFFTDTPKTLNFDTEVAIKRINDYDNAVRYQDYILTQMIERVRKLDDNATFLYFSDHGEETYHMMEFAGHTDDNPTINMFEIPFFLWSADAALLDSLDMHASKPYLADDLFPQRVRSAPYRITGSRGRAQYFQSQL